MVKRFTALSNIKGRISKLAICKEMITSIQIQSIDSNQQYISSVTIIDRRHESSRKW